MARRMRMAAVLALSIYGLGLQASAAQTNSYPESPVRVLVGFPPGSGPDLVARTLAAKLSSFAASIAAASCLASGADFDSCANAVPDTITASTPAIHPCTTGFMGGSPLLNDLITRRCDAVLSPG